MAEPITKSQLKPCKCGSTANIYHNAAETKWTVCCDGAGCFQRTDEYPKKQQALDAWGWPKQSPDVAAVAAELWELFEPQLWSAHHASRIKKGITAILATAFGERQPFDFDKLFDKLWVAFLEDEADTFPPDKTEFVKSVFRSGATGAISLRRMEEQTRAVEMAIEKIAECSQLRARCEKLEAALKGMVSIFPLNDSSQVHQVAYQAARAAIVEGKAQDGN